MDPITAVTHPDPYPYYADLAARGQIHRDDTLGLWVAVSAAAVTDVLTSDLCAVRPPAEPVPAPLVGRASGVIFGRLARMIEGPGHAAIKPAVAAATAGIERAVGDEVRCWAPRLAEELAHAPEQIVEFAFRLPVYALASVLGVTPERLPEMADQVDDYVRGVAPGAAPGQLERGALAAARLMEQFRVLADVRDRPLATLARAVARDGEPNREIIAANGIGFLSQAYEATAGLIGNTLVALGRYPDQRMVDVSALVSEVVRFDPPVQNTRRFVAHDGVVAGQSMTAGDVVLVILAAANRDPAANPEPDRFDPFRTARTAFTFGAGPHACPGETVAVTIAATGVSALLTAGVRPERLLRGLTYRPSVNTRIPVFSA
jgi:cytochrome P450